MADAQQRQFYKQFSLLFIMGNAANGTLSLPQHYYQLCHPGLVQYQLDLEQQLLHSQVKLQEAFVIWRKLAQPLLTKRHLLMPLRIEEAEHVSEIGCCIQEDFHRYDLQSKTVPSLSMQIHYPLFIFTLDREIAARRERKVQFREQELWKLMKYMAQAALEWQAEYPLERIGSICPFNVCIDPHGRVRVVCRLSFFNNEYALASEVYSPPESRHNSIIKYSLNPSTDPVGIESSAVYSIGMVLLQTLTLQVSGVSLVQTVEKLSLMGRSTFSKQFKEAINAMLEHNPSQRPKMQRVLQQAKYHKTRHS